MVLVRVITVNPSQIKIPKKILFVTISNFKISFSSYRFLKIPTFIYNAQFHSFSPFYLDCLFKFGRRKTVEKFVDFVDYLIVWCKLTTSEMLFEDQKQPKITRSRSGEHGEWGDCSTLVFSRDFCTIRTVWGIHISLVQDRPVLQFQPFLINMPLKDLQDFKVIFFVDGCLWLQEVLIKRGPWRSKNTISNTLPTDFCYRNFFSHSSFFFF